MKNKNLELLNQPLELPCGTVLKNRIIKSAMSDSLGDGRGNPTTAQADLYRRWANGGASALIVGEVQCSSKFAEKPGNLVLQTDSEPEPFRELAQKGAANGACLWLQLGHAGALSHPPISTPKGPSAIDIPGLLCKALTIEEVQSLPAEFARTARLAKSLGFSGVQIHAAHGFLLSQFLSPLFNKRTDEYGGSINARARIVIDVINEVREAVGKDFAVALKLNATDQLADGLQEDESLAVVSLLNKTSIDLIEISGGTYFPGAKSASDAATPGPGSAPYFLDFAKNAKKHTDIPIMVTGGFKTLDHAIDAISNGCTDCIGLARALILNPDLPKHWLTNTALNPEFPTFDSPPEGGVTAWYTMCITDLSQGNENRDTANLEATLKHYIDRDQGRVATWNDRFAGE